MSKREQNHPKVKALCPPGNLDQRPGLVLESGSSFTIAAPLTPPCSVFLPAVVYW